MISVYVFWFWGCGFIFGACTSALTPDTQVTSAVETSQYLDGFKQLQTTLPTTALVEGSNNTTDEHFFFLPMLPPPECVIYRYRNEIYRVGVNGEPSLMAVVNDNESVDISPDGRYIKLGYAVLDTITDESYEWQFPKGCILCGAEWWEADPGYLILRAAPLLEYYGYSCWSALAMIAVGFRPSGMQLTRPLPAHASGIGAQSQDHGAHRAGNRRLSLRDPASTTHFSRRTVADSSPG